MRKFNIRKVLDGLTAGSSSASQQQQQQQHPPGNREPEIQETLQSEHFQLCKVKGAGSAQPGQAVVGRLGSFEGAAGQHLGARGQSAPMELSAPRRRPPPLTDVPCWGIWTEIPYFL